MGLLSKAATNTTAELDEMGKALAARLRSLEADGMRAVTAVSLLKAYGSFKAGFCLTLRRGFYSAWASAGMDDTALMFPQDQLGNIPGKTYYSVNYKPPRGVSPALRFWAFPLLWKASVPVNLFMAAGEEGFFQADAVAAILAECGGVFLPPEKEELPAADESAEITFPETESGETETAAPWVHKEPLAGDGQGFLMNPGLLGRIIRENRGPAADGSPPPPVPPEGAMTDEAALTEDAAAVMEALSGARDKFGPFQGCVIEAAGDDSGNGEYGGGNFAGRMEAVTALFGVSRLLAPGRCLVLFGGAQDGGLIAFHLAKTIPGKAVYRFRAEDPREALSLLTPYLS